MLNVRSFGAVGDGVTKDTKSLQAAIDAAASGGGATIVFPPGQYLAGTLVLRSSLSLHLERGAVLLGSLDHDDYHSVPVDPSGNEAHKQEWWFAQTRYLALLVARGADGITLCGEGLIDGQGAALVANIKERFPAMKPSQLDESVRPALINFVACRNVRILDLRLRNSACWTQVYTDCDGLQFRGLSVHGHAFWNNDGIDLCDCRNATISDCNIDTADDGICLKSGPRACENITITNCIVRSWANGLKFGTASAGVFRNIAVNNLVIWGSGHSGIALESVDGGTIEDVVISNVTMRDLRHGIFLKLGARNRLRSPDAPVGKLRRVMLSNIVMEMHPGDPDAGQEFAAPPMTFPHNAFPCIISGLPGNPIEEVTLSNVLLVTPGGGDAKIAGAPLEMLHLVPENETDYPEYYLHGELPAHGWYIRHVRGLALHNVRVQCEKADYRPPMVCDDVQEMIATDLHFTPLSASPTVVLNNVRRATLRNLETLESVRVLRDCADIGQTR